MRISKKRIIITILLLPVVLIVVFLIWRYITYSFDSDPHKTFLLPKVELAVAEVTSLTADQTELNLQMLVKNNLPFTLKADSLVYNISINNIETVKSTYGESITLKSKESSWISLPLTVFNQHLKDIKNASEQNNIDSAVYRLQASLYTDLLFKKEIQLDIKRLLPLVTIPEVTTEKMEVDSLNFSRAVIILHALVDNTNGFPLQASNITYKFAIEDHDWMEGSITGHTDIKADSVTPLEIPIRVSIKEVAKTLLDLITKGRGVRYKLQLNCTIESENDMLRNSKAVLKSSGSVKSLMKAVKE